MISRRILFFVMILMLLIAVGVGGYYFYISYFPKEVTSVSTEDPTLVTTAILAGIKNGGNTIYPQSVGGIDDFNNGSTLPVDSYYKVWTACNDGNNYCGTNDSIAEKMDPNTGTVWSRIVTSNTTWFAANNCKYPNGLTGDDGVCDTNGEPACLCVKHIGGEDKKTGCEAVGDGKWRLPYQKELMQSYIDGSWANLKNTQVGFWSATTCSNLTDSAWVVDQNNGYVAQYAKNAAPAVTRCVR